MKLRSLVLALIAVISASAMAANTCDESFSITGFKVYQDRYEGYKDKTATGKIGDLNSTTAPSLISDDDKTKKLFDNVNQAFSIGINSGKTGVELTNLYTEIVFTHYFYKNDPKGKANIAALVSGVSTLSAKVKECEAFRAVDPCDAIIASLEQAIVAMPSADPTPALSICPDVCKTPANKNLCDQKYQAALLAKQNRDSELGNSMEVGALDQWMMKFEAIDKATGTPNVDSHDLLSDLVNFKRTFKQDGANIGKIKDLEEAVKKHFASPCFNAKFTSNNNTRNGNLSGLEALKSSYSIEQVETILNNSDYYTNVDGSTKVIKDHVSMCALVWVVTAYNKTAGNDHNKRKAIAESLVNKFGAKDEYSVHALTGLVEEDPKTVIAIMGSKTNKIDTRSIYPELILNEIKKMPGYKVPSSKQRSSDEFVSWIDQVFPLVNGVVEVDYEKVTDLVLALLNLSDYNTGTLDVVVQKIFDKFGTSTLASFEDLKNSIVTAHNNSSKENIEALVYSLKRNTTSLSVNDESIEYIVEAVVGTTTPANPAGGTPSGNPSSGSPAGSQSPDVNGDGKFSSTEVSDFVEDVTQVNADNVEDLVSMLLGLENYEEATLDAIVDSILNTFGAKGDAQANKTAIINAIVKAKTSKSKADIQALVQAIIDNTNIDVADLGGASAASTIANNIVASPVVKQKSYSLDEVKGRVDGTGTVTPKQKSYNFQEIMDAVDGK